MLHRQAPTILTAMHMDDIDEKVRYLDEHAPLVPHTNAGRLFSTVRRMKAEKDLAIPISRRTGFVIAVKSGKSANKLTRDEWEELFEALSSRLKRDYPDLYQQVFRNRRRTKEQP